MGNSNSYLDKSCIWCYARCMDFQTAEQILLENGYKFFYEKIVSGRSYDDPDGNEVMLTNSEVITLAEKITSGG